MTPEEKIYKVLNALTEIISISPQNDPNILLDPTHINLSELGMQEINNILNKLDVELNLIEIKRYSSLIPKVYKSELDRFADYQIPKELRVKYHIEILNIDELKNMYFEYKKYDNTEIDNEVSRLNDKVLWIDYSEANQQIILNDIFLLVKPHFGSVNEMVFNYLYNNPNKVVNRAKLVKEATRENFTKRFHDIVQELGFKKDLKKAFFKVSKNDILFKNPVSKKDLDNLGIHKIKIN